MIYYKIITGDNLPSTVILADGTYPSLPLAEGILRRVPVVCCDGAAAGLLAHGIEPVAIVGDGDSLSPDIKGRYASLCCWENEQETNDLSKAFRYCLRRGWRDLLILGATGRREDHTLGNISLLVDYGREARVQMLTDRGLFTPVTGDAEFESSVGQQVSLFNFGCQTLRGEGLAYPLSPFTKWWQGTLNESRGATFRVYADGDYLVYRVL